MSKVKARASSLLPFVLMMGAIVVLANVAVQFPVRATLGPVNLADLLTWGAFIYPAAFLITDLANRRFGPAAARKVVFIGFVLAVILSVWLATPRIAIASGSAFLVAQMLDIAIFDRLRTGVWWKAPLVSSIVGSLVDTAMFFSLAFAAGFVFLGANDEFAIASAPLIGFLDMQTPRWISWGLGDLAVKLVVALTMLVPYRILLARMHGKDHSGPLAPPV